MVKTITDDTFDELMKNTNCVLINFSSDLGAVGKQFKSIFESVSEIDEYKDINFFSCNTEQNEDLCTKFSIKKLPTTVYIKNGTVVYRQVGAVSKTIFQDSVNSNLK